MAVRYPRGAGVGRAVQPGFVQWPWGKGEVRRRGQRIAILAFGTLLYPALQAADKLDATVANMRFAKPLDEPLLHAVLKKFDKIITVEDGTVVGGFGSAVAEFMTLHGYKADLKILGIPDRIVEHGTLKELHRECGYDAEAIAAAVREMMNTAVTMNVLQ